MFIGYKIKSKEQMFDKLLKSHQDNSILIIRDFEQVFLLGTEGLTYERGI